MREANLAVRFEVRDQRNSVTDCVEIFDAQINVSSGITAETANIR